MKRERGGFSIFRRYGERSLLLCKIPPKGEISKRDCPIQPHTKRRTNLMPSRRLDLGCAFQNRKSPSKDPSSPFPLPTSLKEKPGSCQSETGKSNGGPVLKRPSRKRHVRIFSTNRRTIPFLPRFLERNRHVLLRKQKGDDFCHPNTTPLLQGLCLLQSKPGSHPAFCPPE